jgi:hypothetical protein
MGATRDGGRGVCASSKMGDGSPKIDERDAPDDARPETIAGNFSPHDGSRQQAAAVRILLRSF